MIIKHILTTGLSNLFSVALTKSTKRHFADYFYMRKLPKQGCLRFKNPSKKTSYKRPPLVRRGKYRLSNHNGLLKRIRIVIL